MDFYLQEKILQVNNFFRKIITLQQVASAPLLLGLLGVLAAGVKLTNHANKIVERLLHIHTGLRAGFLELRAEGFPQLRAFVGADLSLLLQVALVANQHHGQSLSILHAEHLLLEGRNLLKGGTGSDGEDDHKSFAVANPLVSQGRELLLPCGIENLQKARLLVNHDLLAVAVFDSGVVLLHKVVGAKLNGQSGLADTSIAKDADLVVCLHHVVSTGEITRKLENERERMRKCTTPSPKQTTAHQ
jgi:hypothetical protein